MTKSSRFPSDFLWGAATSAYQIEGAAHEDGKGLSIWDNFSHRIGTIEDGSNGDVACDHYHRLEEDLALLSGLNVNAYRFSIAWPRVQPDGRGAWNARGMDFYDRLVDRLLARGIAPHATLYHWDLPQTLQDNGGWLNRDTCQYFADYACHVVARLGDRVQAFATHNEPFVAAMLGNLLGIHAPGLKNPKTASQVAHHLLLSHGMALQGMRALTDAALGIVLNLSPATPASAAPADQNMAAEQFAFVGGWYLDPLFKGSYPSLALPIPLPEIQAGDMDIIHQPMDFMGINYYFREWCSASIPPVPAPCERGVSEMGWEIYPEGLYELLTQLKQAYPLPPLYITENGVACSDAVLNDGAIHDVQRIDFIESHLAALHRAMQQGVDVRGYFYWSLMDNFEWSKGYSKRFGLIHIDYSTQQRSLKDSALWYRNYIQAERFGAQQKEAML